MKIGSKHINSYMGLKFEFAGVRILHEMLYSTRWSLEVNLVAVDCRKHKSTDAMQRQGNVAFQKLYFWLESVLPGVVLTNVNNPVSLSIAGSVENVMLFCPDEPTDDLFVRLLHSKLSAIAGDNLHIGEIKLNASDTTTTYTFCVDETGYHLPTTVKEYIDLPSLYKKPWWVRDDGFSFEFLKKRGMKGKLTDLYAGLEDPLKEFEGLLVDGIPDLITEPAEIIQVEKWKPKQV